MSLKDKSLEKNPPKVPYFAPKKEWKPKIEPVFVGEQQVTRSKSRFYAYYGVKECFVGIPKNIQADSLAWLYQTNAHESTIREANPKTVGIRRRNSVIGHGLYSVNNHVVEKGTDFLKKVPRTNGDDSNGMQSSQPSCSTTVAIASTKFESGRMKNLPALMKLSEVMVSGSNKASDIAVQSSCSSTIAIVPAEIVSRQIKNVPALLKLSEIGINGSNKASEIHVQPSCSLQIKNVPALLKLSEVGGGGSNEPVEFNDFCPFRRLPNVPFAINGRPRGRSKSVDSYKPSLETLFETEHEHAQDIVRKWVGRMNF